VTGFSESERRRIAVLDILDVFRGRGPGVSLNSVVAFLQASENEGVCMKELAFLCRLSDATASRCVRALAAPGTPGALAPALGLIELFQNPRDGRGRLVFLTEDGRALRDAIEAALGAAPPAGSLAG
jgi:DNA-binding MarR family transcriptional regulator